MNGQSHRTHHWCLSYHPLWRHPSHPRRHSENETGECCSFPLSIKTNTLEPVCTFISLRSVLANGICNETSGHCVCSPGYTGVSCDESKPTDILKMCCDVRSMYVVVAVLPLVVRFINDSPCVMGDSVEADILISRPVQSLICRLKAGSFITEQDCEC